MKLFLQVVCLTFPIAAVFGCKPLRDQCDSHSKFCCGDSICSEDGFCEDPPSKLTKCKSDKECNGVRGSCFEGSCLSICRADSDCGKGSICVDGKSTLGGFCETNCSFVFEECSNKEKCCAKFFCNFFGSTFGRCEPIGGLTCLPENAGVLPKLPCCTGLINLDGVCSKCRENGKSCKVKDHCCGKMICGSNKTCEDPK